VRVNLPINNDEHVLPDTDVIVSRADALGRIIYVNETFVRMSGFSRDELMGNDHNIVRHPDMPREAFADLWHTIKAGKPWSGMVKNRRKDGGFYWIMANVTPMIDNGSIVGYMSVRTAPSATEKRAAAELYRKMAAGELHGQRLEAGELLYTGWRGAIQRFARSSFNVRAWLTAAGLAGLNLALLALAFTLPSSGTTTAMMALCGLGVLAALACGAWWSAVIARPIASALATAIAVVGGNVSVAFPRKGEPELTKLFRIIEQMNSKLVGVLKDVNGGASSVAAAANEIAAGNMNLSQRTEEQASSLEETAASMEELTSTVQQNAGNAEQANTLAAQASATAAHGGDVVRRVVETMATIEHSSRKIAEINSTIDGIAFQTNILALNAAVEAARAGEQGRGFAVVAAEVRSLAQRSAAAAKEIKQLIQESVAEVGEGARLVDDAGRTMEDIVTAVQRVAEIMSEINAASNEQSAGIGQVNQAVSQMDHVTQQNAALVEEVAAAAEDLRSHMRVVNDAMGAFQFARAGAAAPAAHEPAVARERVRRKNVTPLPTKRAKAKPSMAAAKTGTDDEWTEF